jgi:pimeloyl-ACP methyl ester carboxylesterase
VKALILSITPPGVVEQGGGLGQPRLLAVLDTICFGVLQGYRPEFYWRELLEWVTGDPTEVGDALVREYYDINRRQPERNSRLRPIPVTPGEILPLLAKVRSPTLLLWGAKGPVLPPPTMRRMRRELVNATVSSELLPDTGHYAPGEDPEIIAARIHAFLAQHGASR